MKKQGRRWIGAILAMLMLVISVCTDAGVNAQAATNKAVTRVSIANLPEGNALSLEDTYSYDFNAAKNGTGVVYFEVKNGTNTAGVQSSNSGIVYPITTGQFEIRVVAFTTKANRTKWVNARKANGYVADPNAEKYVAASSDWTTIKVTSQEEGLAVARKQSQLDKVLKNKNVKNVLIWTEVARDFEIANKNYKTKTLTVKAPNSDVTNAGRFAQINVEQIKSSTFHEKAKGNKINVIAVNARVVIEKGARVSELLYGPSMKTADVAKEGSFNFRLEINGTVGMFQIAPTQTVANETAKPVVEVSTAADANVSEVKVSEPSDVTISGENETAVNVTVDEAAKGSTLTAQTPVNADLKANTTVTLAEEAKNSVLTVSEKNVELDVKAADSEKTVENVTVNVSKDAEGAKVASEVKVSLELDVKVEVTFDKGAEGSTITTGENVEMPVVTNKTDEAVEVTDSTGSTSKVEADSENVQVTTPTPTDTPATTSTPSNPSTNPTPDPTGTPTTTPTVTPIPSDTPDASAPSVTYKVGTTGTATSVGELTANGTDKYTGSVTISKANDTDTITFAAEDYTISEANAKVSDFTAGTAKEITLTLKKDTTTITVVLTVTITTINTTGTSTPTIKVDVAVSSTTITGSAITSSGAAITATATAAATDGVVTVKADAGTYTGEFKLTATASVTGVTSPKISYAWYKGGEAIDGETANTYSINLGKVETAIANDQYYVQVEYTDDNNKTWIYNSKDKKVNEKQ